MDSYSKFLTPITRKIFFLILSLINALQETLPTQQVAKK